MRADFWSRDLYLGCMNACFAWKGKGELLLFCAQPAHPDHERQADEKHRQSLVGQGKERNDDPGDPQTRGSGGIVKLRVPRVFCCEYGVPPEIQGDRVPEPVNAEQDVQVLTRRYRKFHGCDGQNPSNRSCHQCA